MSFRRLIDRHTIFTITLMAGCGKTHFSSSPATNIKVRDDTNASRRRLKKAAILTHPTPARQGACLSWQCHSKRRGEEVHTKLRLNRSSITCERISPFPSPCALSL